jgi:hypothetical protein
LVVPPKRSARVVANCADFRHGSQWTFDGIVWLDPRDGDLLTVSVRVTAANMRGESFQTATIEKEIIDVHASKLVDLTNGRLIEPIPLADTLYAALEAGDYDTFETA